jgi:hypothetical protein
MSAVNPSMNVHAAAGIYAFKQAMNSQAQVISQLINSVPQPAQQSAPPQSLPGNVGKHLNVTA